MNVPQTQTRIDVFDRILCGVDGSVASHAAVTQARTLLSPIGSIGFVAVVDPPATVYSAYGAPALIDDMVAAAGRELDASAEGLPGARKELLYGSVVGRLLEEIAEYVRRSSPSARTDTTARSEHCSAEPRATSCIAHRARSWWPARQGRSSPPPSSPGPTAPPALRPPSRSLATSRCALTHRSG